MSPHDTPPEPKDAPSPGSASALPQEEGEPQAPSSTPSSAGFSTVDLAFPHNKGMREKVLKRQEEQKRAKKVRSARLSLAVKHSLDRSDSPSILRLDPATYRSWIDAAKLRIAGIEPAQIASLLELERSLVDRLLSDPRYQCFEAEMRNSLLSGREMDALKAKILSLAGEAIEVTADIMRAYKTDRTALSDSRQAAKQIGIWAGLEQTGGFRVRAGVRDLPDGRTEFLLEAVAKRGA